MAIVDALRAPLDSDTVLQAIREWAVLPDAEALVQLEQARQAVMAEPADLTALVTRVHLAVLGLMAAMMCFPLEARRVIVDLGMQMPTESEKGHDDETS